MLHPEDSLGVPLPSTSYLFNTQHVDFQTYQLTL